MSAFLPVILNNIWRTGNVMLNRYLGTCPRYCPVMVLFITGRCNLRCRMCGVCDLEHGYRDEDELTTEQWKNLIYDAVTSLGTTLAVISGGEVLLRKDLFDIIRYAANQGVSIHLCTNAILLDEEKILQLRDSGVSTVSISIEGPQAEIHEYIRGSNTFAPVVSAIQKMRKIAPQIHIGINYVITKYNFIYMTDMLHFAEKLGVHQIKFAPIHTNLLHKDKDFSDCSDLLFQEEDIPALEREVQRVREACRKSTLNTTSDAFFEGITQLPHTSRSIRCYAGYAICSVGPSGYVTPCSEFDSPFNVKERSIVDIWRDPAFHVLRKKVDDCSSACWDTTHTELSLWLRPATMIMSFTRILRDIKFYFGNRKK